MCLCASHPLAYQSLAVWNELTCKQHGAKSPYYIWRCRIKAQHLLPCTYSIYQEVWPCRKSIRQHPSVQNLLYNKYTHTGVFFQLCLLLLCLYSFYKSYLNVLMTHFIALCPLNVSINRPSLFSPWIKIKTDMNTMMDTLLIPKDI